MKKTRLRLRHRYALGDTVLMTGLVRDIHRAYPDKYEIEVDTHFTNVWWNNPFVVKDKEKNSKHPPIELSWLNAIHWNSYAKYGTRQEMKHILAWYHYDFGRHTGIEVPVTDPWPDLHLDASEKIRRVAGRYWVVISGGKLDLTTKHWHTHRVQEVVDKLSAFGIRCVQTGAVNQGHVHAPLNNVVNLIGKTENARDLFNVIMHADGVICGVTAAMHIAAAFRRPCVVFAGGREEPWFEAYVNSFEAFGPTANPVPVEHKFLHTIGLLECCDKQGCWKRRVVPIDPPDRTTKVHTMCRNPVRPEHSHPVAKCQDLITSDHIVEAVMDYYDKNVLPPISQTPKTIFPPNPDLKKDESEGIRIPQVELIRVDAAGAAQPEIVREPSNPVRTQKVYQQAHPLEIKSHSGIMPKVPTHILDNPLLGGKITVCVLCYGPHANLARRCLSSILATVPAERLDLRVATNEASQETVSYLRKLPLTKLYVNSANKFKYPVMRNMFYDDSCPIVTSHVVWFDDDTWVVQPHWLANLAQTIIDNHHYGFRMYGSLMYHDLRAYASHGTSWFREAGWYKGKSLRVKSKGAEAPNGTVIDFAVGWCWAIETAAMRAADVPDVRLGHNGGDITIGEQMHQAGFGIKSWNLGKSLVACPSRENGGRRGYSERFPWDPSGR